MGYPIGTLLFWKTTKKAIIENNLVLYEFIKDYHQRDCADNKKAPEKLVTDYDNYYLVLDGQQRLSALYIALQGSIAYKIKKKWWNTDEAFPKKKSVSLLPNSSFLSSPRDVFLRNSSPCRVA